MRSERTRHRPCTAGSSARRTRGTESPASVSERPSWRRVLGRQLREQRFEYLDDHRHQLELALVEEAQPLLEEGRSAAPNRPQHGRTLGADADEVAATV